MAFVDISVKTENEFLQINTYGSTLNESIFAVYTISDTGFQSILRDKLNVFTSVYVLHMGSQPLSDHSLLFLGVIC